MSERLQAVKKLGFWSVFALVTGSQIGSGVFLAPTNLAPFGLYSLLGWVISGVGAIALSLVFARLCGWFPKTGGPHVYIKQAFGSVPAFFTGWTYWVVSWVSTTVVIIACIGYLEPLIGVQTWYSNLFLELVLLGIVTMLNLRGVGIAGRAEFFLTMLKVIPLVIIPAIALFSFNSNNFVLDSSLEHVGFIPMLSRIAFLTFWCFVGLESGTTAAGSVENPGTTIPKAVVAGTVVVAGLYIFNSLGIMGVVPAAQLLTSTASYADAVQIVLGGSWHVVISCIASCICLGTLNAWILTSGQIALGLSQDNLMPTFFGKKNSSDAPYVGLLISSLAIVPLLCSIADQSIASQVLTIIDFSVTSFLFMYGFCCLALFKILFEKRHELSICSLLISVFYTSIALAFCTWIVCLTSVKIVAIASLFTLSGIPVFWYVRSNL